MNCKKVTAILTAAVIFYGSSLSAVNVNALSNTKNEKVTNLSEKIAIVEEKIPQSELTAVATSQESRDPASSAIDGNINTMWHTPWNGLAKLPQSLTINLGNKRNISSIVVNPRATESNGIITKYEIYAINNGKETLIKSGRWEQESKRNVISFENSVEADAIKITALEGVGGWASIAEVNVYEKSKETAPIKSYGNTVIKNNGDEVDISNDIDALKNLEEGTIIARFNSNDISSVHSILGISNNKTNNGHFHLYTTGSRIGMEVRNQTEEGNTPNGTTNLAHVYADVSLNKGINTLALKVNKNEGYTLYLNGKIVKTFADNNAKFLDDITGLNSAFLGKVKRNSGNEYLYKGNIDFVNIYKEPLSDNYILKITGETAKPSVDENLPEGVYKSDVIDVFKPGELGSNNFRIPSIITTLKGTLLSGIDVRVGGGHDSPNNIDTAVKRSVDGGMTWDEGQVVINYPDKASTIDSSLLQDKETGRIFLLVDAFPDGYGAFQAKHGSGFKTINGERCMILLDENNIEFYAKPDGKIIDKDGNATVYTVDAQNNLYENGVKIGNTFAKTSKFKAFGTSYLALIHSDDDGQTWSEPKIISGQFKKEWMSFLGTGPGVGHQIKNGDHKGRLVFPVYSLNLNKKQNSAVIYSDDGGETWNLGESPNDGRIEGNTVLSAESLNNNAYELTESQVVEMPNGQLKLFMRNRNGYTRIATSFDGGETWDEHVELDKDLREPYCQLSVINYSKKVDGKDALIFSNPDATSRANGAVKIGLINEVGTYENGEPKYDFEWKYNKLIKPGYYAYSSLTELSDGKIGLFYEGTDNREMSFTSMNTEYIKYNPDEQAPAAKVKSIKVLNDKSYSAGDDISLKVIFDQAVSIIGDRTLNVSIGNELSSFTMLPSESAKEYVFTGKIPENIKNGQYDITVKANKNTNIYNIYNKLSTISNDIVLEDKIQIENSDKDITPGKVENLKAINITNKSLKLKWDKPLTSENIREYVLYKDGVELTRVNGEITEFNIEDLKSNTLYGFKILAIGENNKKGRPVSINMRTLKE
ncbi:sialidase domain-containing protein [Clostridium tarantellae]|uniref:exo-alpha-sialidase n=1 Tax=Clostridium tarantellae TaxID=39493 RepID=A0A6I1MQ39_9CLOT|nr:sialidase domain-containing protein [Clostridium tarantellae]MPQ42991.1 exo-alpha-sialidase [Clostridium tarantellae]